MRSVKINELSFIPASHENALDPEVWKKVLVSHKDNLAGKIMMVNWSKLPKGRAFRRHYHEDMEEIFILIKGKALMIAGDQQLELLDPGDTLIVPSHVVHTMKNIGARDVYYIVIGVARGDSGKTINI